MDDADREAEGPSFRDILDGLRSAALELLRADSQDELCKRAVALGRELLAIDRIGILMYDAATGERRGTWGTDEKGELADERDYRAKVPVEEGFVAECLSRKDFLGVWEDHELTYRDIPVGRGWNAMVALWDGDEAIGWIAADNLLRLRPLIPSQRDGLVLYGQLVSSLLARRRNQDELEQRIARRTAEIQAREEGLRARYHELETQNAMRERLFTILAHDLRSPLGAVKSLFDTAADPDSGIGPAEVAALLPEMSRSVSSVYALVQNLLDWVRAQMEEITVLRERVPLAQALSAARDALFASASAKGIAIAIEAPAGATLYADGRMVETILRNFLSNAIKYSGEFSRITIAGSYSPERAETRIAVRDQGTGMDEQVLSSLFALNSAKRRDGTAGERGSGLGLFFCNDLAEQLGGRIEVQSSPGEGSTFTLVIPDPVEGELPGVE